MTPTESGEELMKLITHRPNGAALLGHQHGRPNGHGHQTAEGDAPAHQVGPQREGVVAIVRGRVVDEREQQNQLHKDRHSSGRE